MLPGVDRRVAHHLAVPALRACRAVVCTALLWFCCALVALAVPTRCLASNPAEGALISSSVDPRVPPALGLDPSGRLYLAWQVPDAASGQAALLVATRPYTLPTSVASAAASAQAAASSQRWAAPYILPDDNLSIAWAAGTGGAGSVQAVLGDERASWDPGGAEVWTYTLAPDGALTVAWFAEHVLVIERPGEAGMITYPISPDRRVTDVRLSYARSGVGVLAFSTVDLSGQGSDIWYAPLMAGAAPIRLVAEGHLQAAVAGDDGIIHLAWDAADGLWYGDSRGTTARIADGFVGGVALALGPDGQAHIAWIGQGTLHYAQSSNWQLSSLILARTDVLSCAIAVDRFDHPHVAWVEAGSGDGARLLLYEPALATPMLAISWPLEGELARAGSLARAETNLAPDDWDHLAFFLQPVDARGDTAPLRALGEDRDGSDGWTVAIQDSGEQELVRLVVIGEDRQGRVARATGEPFALIPAEQGILWADDPDGRVAGSLILNLASAAELDASQPIGVYLVSIAASGAHGAAADPVYAGRAELDTVGVGGRLTLDTQALSDGTYNVFVTGTGNDGEPYVARGAGSITIDNVRAPLVSAVRWDDDSGGSRLEAEIGAAGRTPTQVDFYVQSVAPSAEDGDVAEVGQLQWLGADTDASDGWSLTFSEPAGWQGSLWRGWAIACDARGLCGTGSSDPAQFTEPDAPALWLAAPAGGARLSGSSQIALYGDIGIGQVLRVTAYLEQDDGALLKLGKLRWDGRSWGLQWGADAFAAGTYRILLRVALGWGGGLSLWSEPFEIAENTAAWRLNVPAGAVEGEVPVSLVGGEATAVTYYLQDGAGELHSVGQGIAGGGAWSALWNTHDVLNGEYELVAVAQAAHGPAVAVKAPVTVANEGLQVEFLRVPDAETVGGVTSLSWHTEGGDGDVSVAIEYSSDGGATWQMQANSLGASGTWRWDTGGVADSRRAYLRLVATDGGHAAVAVRGPFVVDNVNEPPSVALLWPLEGEHLAAGDTIRWQASDPDGDELNVDLMVRHGEGAPWVPLGTLLDPEGAHIVRSSEMAPGEGYALRIVARDSRGTSATDTVTDLTVTDNAPPSVALVWPAEDTTLVSSAAILWRTSDPDGDHLTIDLYYSDDQGLSWVPLADSLDDTGYYLWEVSFLPPGVSYRLKIVARDGEHVVWDESQAVITIGEPALPTISLSAPWAGSTVSGVTRMIWQASAPSQHYLEAELLMRVSGATEWSTLARMPAQAGEYLWDTTLVQDGAYELAVRLSRGAESVTSNLATLVHVRNARPAASLSLLAPSDGDLVAGLHAVRWSSAGLADDTPVTIEQSLDAGLTWEPAGTALAGDGLYIWDSDVHSPASGALLRVSATSADGAVLSDVNGPVYLGGRGLWPTAIEGSLGAASDGTSAQLAWDAEDPDGLPVDVAISQCTASGDCGECTFMPEARGTLSLALPAQAGEGLAARIVAVGQFYTTEALVSWQTTVSPQDGPTVVLLAPLDRERLSGSVPISWDASAPDERPIAIDIDYTADGGLTWRSVIADLENVGRYLWQTTLMPNGDYRVRVTARTESGAAVDTTGEFILAAPGHDAPAVSLSVDGAALAAVGSRAVAWHAAGSNGSAASGRLEYALDPQGPWNVLDESLGQSAAGWSAQQLPSGQVWLRLVVAEGGWESTSPVAGPYDVRHGGCPGVRLEASAAEDGWTPADGLAWAATWTDGSVRVNLAFSLDGGSTWQTLATGMPAVGHKVWPNLDLPLDSLVEIRAVARADDRVGISQLVLPVACAASSATSEAAP